MVRYLFYTIGDLTYQSPFVVAAADVATGSTEVVATCSKASSSVVFITIFIYVLTEQHNGQLQSA